MAKAIPSRYNDAGDRWCTACETYLPVAYFRPTTARKASPDGLRSRCQACINRARRERYARHAEAERERARAYQRAHGVNRASHRLAQRVYDISFALRVGVPRSTHRNRTQRQQRRPVGQQQRRQRPPARLGAGHTEARRSARGA